MEVLCSGLAMKRPCPDVAGGRKIATVGAPIIDRLCNVYCTGRVKKPEVIDVDFLLDLGDVWSLLGVGTRRANNPVKLSETFDTTPRIKANVVLVGTVTHFPDGKRSVEMLKVCVKTGPKTDVELGQHIQEEMAHQYRRAQRDMQADLVDRLAANDPAPLASPLTMRRRVVFATPMPVWKGFVDELETSIHEQFDSVEILESTDHGVLRAMMAMEPRVLMDTILEYGVSWAHRGMAAAPPACTIDHNPDEMVWLPNPHVRGEMRNLVLRDYKEASGDGLWELVVHKQDCVGDPPKNVSHFNVSACIRNGFEDMVNSSWVNHVGQDLCSVLEAVDDIVCGMRVRAGVIQFQTLEPQPNDAVDWRMLVSPAIAKALEGVPVTELDHCNLPPGTSAWVTVYLVCHPHRERPNK